MAYEASWYGYADVINVREEGGSLLVCVMDGVGVG